MEPRTPTKPPAGMPSRDAEVTTAVASREKKSERKKLTDKLIAALPVPAERVEIPDSESKGLRLRCGPSGSRVFIYYGREGGKRTLETLGPWGVNGTGLTVAEARAAYAKRTTSTKRARGSGAALTVKDVAEEWMKRVEKSRRHPGKAQRVLDLDVLPAIGDKPIATVTTGDCREIVKAVVARGSPVHAGTVLQVLKQLLRHAQGNDYIPSNPAAALDAGAVGVEANVSDRYLTAEEIPLFWHALDRYKGLSPTIRLGLRILLLTGVRSGELIKATWDEIDLDAATWTIPVAHQKLTKRREAKARPFVIPLAPLAVELFRDLHGLAKGLGSRYVLATFAARCQGEPITEKSLNHAMRKMFEGSTPLLTFAGERPTPHDLRRTVRTHLGETLGIPWHTAERCLNHSLGKITATYDVGDYIAERRAALEKWCAYIERLVARDEKSVAFLPARAKA